LITLLTDFGLSGPYIGAVKGVILGINPDVRIVDISHEIGPQNVDEAAFVLKEAYCYFPPKTIHVIIVDPGVGSNREILAVQTEMYTFLAPDNGVLKYIFDAYPTREIYRVTNEKYFRKIVSQTFHGRDIFAPVAAHLSKKLPIDRLGEKTDYFIPGKVLKPVITENQIIGEIIYFDRFGNAVTNIDRSILKGNNPFWIRIKDQVIDHISKTYEEMESESIRAIVGSHNAIEIASNTRSARSILDLKVGDSLVIEWKNQ